MEETYTSKERTLLDLLKSFGDGLADFDTRTLHLIGGLLQLRVLP
jgi:hypothetical protein